METRAEYEDVLSSIRRLVSEEVRSRAPLADVKSDPKSDARSAQTSPTVEKLVLTPAQRISPSPSEDSSAPALEASRASGSAAPLILHPVDAAAGTAPENLSLDGDLDSDKAALPQDSDEDPFASFEDVFGKEEWPRAPQADSRLASLERTIAELEAVVSDQGHVYEPDGSEDEGSSPEVEPLRVVPSRSRPAEPDLSVEVDEVTAEEGHDDLPSFLRSAPDAEPAVEVPEGSTEPAPEEHRGEAPLDIEEDSPADAPEAAIFGSMPDEEDAVLLDEEALRQMVRDLVREELQGVLGERITRNVRKLVRTEIHRIVASQDFD